MTKDPVCGMQIDESETIGQRDYKGKTYYFCSLLCRDAFDKDPSKYAEKGGAGPSLERKNHQR